MSGHVGWSEPEFGCQLRMARWGRRVAAVLIELYRSFRRQEPMSAKVLHGRRALPALDALLARTRDANIAKLTNTLAAGFAANGAARATVRAAIALALDFWTWQRLTQEGLTDDKAAKLMADFITSASRT